MNFVGIDESSYYLDYNGYDPYDYGLGSGPVNEKLLFDGVLAMGHGAHSTAFI